MSAIRIATATVLAASLVLAWGCKKPDEAPRKGPTAPVEAAESTPAVQGSPSSYANKTPAAEVALKLPAALSAQPDLHARLYAEGVRDLKAFAEGAANDRAEMGGEDAQPYDRTIEWSLGANTSKLMSLSAIQSEYTGGAHGNASYAAILWDKALKRQIAPAGLFVPGVDAAMNTALCDALVAQKKVRTETYYTPPGGDWNCPKWRDTPFELVASTTPGKAGGIRFLIAPYVAGAYAEGVYDPVVPLSVFARFLKPAYADEFAGTPKPVTQAST